MGIAHLTVYQKTLEVSTAGRGTYLMTQEIQSVVGESGVTVGTVNVFNRHTSASLILTENADPDVRRDLETFMSGLVTDGDRRFLHQDEGPDDMSAHIRSVLTPAGFTLPIGGARLLLGTWQGVYLWEHRTHPHLRQLVVTVMGQAESAE